MATNQEALHASVCGFLGTTPGTYESDWSALFTSAGFTTGDFNGRMLRWLNQQMGTAYTNLPGAQSAYADIFGAANWSALGSITDADATAYFALSGTLTPGRKALVNMLITALKAGSVWTKLDYLLLTAIETSQSALVDIKGLRQATAVNTPTFTADQGYAGNGTTSYITTGFIPATHGVAFTLNAAHVSVYVRTSRTTADASAVIGVQDLTPSAHEVAIYPRFTGNVTHMRVNESAAAGPDQTNAQGWWLANRSLSTAKQWYKNATSFSTANTTPVALADFAIFAGGKNNSGTPANLSTDQFAAISLGGSLSQAEVTAFKDALEAYMDAIGAGVI